MPRMITLTSRICGRTPSTVGEFQCASEFPDGGAKATAVGTAMTPPMVRTAHIHVGP